MPRVRVAPAVIASRLSPRRSIARTRVVRPQPVRSVGVSCASPAPNLHPPRGRDVASLPGPSSSGPATIARAGPPNAAAPLWCPELASAALHVAAFLSGASALLFEALWFRQAGLAFGNGLWASSIVLSSFMAGLAVGSGLAARAAARLERPARTYAALELAIGLSGLALVALLPLLPELLAPALRALGEGGWILQAVRFATAFALLVLPAVAMGATLPVLVRAVATREADFGRVLGRLYGWNTLGAVVGAASSELVWLPALGVFGSGVAAATLNVAAAVLAGLAARPLARVAPREAPAERRGVSLRAGRLLGASFLAGAIVLALEVVWFRFLSLYLATTSLAFSVMLAVVLAGIGLGSLGAAAWLRRRPDAEGSVAGLALVSGALCVLCYAGFEGVLASAGVRKSGRPGDVLALALPLVFPVASLSGALFVLLGRKLGEQLGEEARSTGLLVLANTAGSMLGPLLAGFVLLPRLGMEVSLFLLSGAYGFVALLALGPLPATLRSGPLLAAAAAFLGALVLFPHGRMDRAYLDVIARRLESRGERIVAVREGHLETIQYAERSFLGEPLFHRMVTDGYSMSATTLQSKRYMELFTYLPAALHPRLERALLISFGVGMTAASLVSLDELERLDVVDISPEVLEMSEVVFPDPADHPLRDPRVHIHVEDGRHFLQTTTERFDLITGEPPPPAYAGVVNLYTREYFDLVRGRLAEGGLASYWLPVGQLREIDARAIVAAFCGAFATCTLWVGTAPDWILLGAREPLAPVRPEGPARLFATPATATRLVEIGVERPEDLGALFIADADQLRDWVGTAPPLVDNWPHRAPIPMPGLGEAPAEFADLLDAGRSRQRFRESRWVAATLPEPLRRAVDDVFWVRDVATRQLADPGLRLDAADRALLHTDRAVLPLWLLGSEVAKQRIAARAGANGAEDARRQYELGLGALAGRSFDEAVVHLRRVPEGSRLSLAARLRELYALCRAGRLDETRAGLAELENDPSARLRGYLAWMREHCGGGAEP